MDEKLMIRMIRIGKALEILENIRQDEIFDNLSKHACIWQSEHQPEAEQLHLSRVKLGRIHEALLTVLNLIGIGDFDE